MNETRAHLLIDGRVQGVFFRAFVREVAHNLGLNGWVRNLRDGRVETVFEGEKALIQLAIQKCHVGPPGARVSGIEVLWENYTGKESGFNIRYG